MLTSDALARMSHELSACKVLSIYVDTLTTDPAQRSAGRTALQSAIRTARAGIDNIDDRLAFERAVALLNELANPPTGMSASPGWVAFITADRVWHATGLPLRPTTVATWREGPLVTPYLRALKQHRPVIIALVESRSIRLCRYALGSVEVIDTIDTIAGEDRSRRSARAQPAPRGAVGTEAGRRQQLAAFRRTARALAERLAQYASGDEVILVGGTPEWSQLVPNLLPRRFRPRLVVSATLDHDANLDELGRAAERTASHVRAVQGTALVERLVNLAGAGGRAAIGAAAVEHAAARQAIDLLLVSPDALSGAIDEIEHTVRAAFAQGADVEVLSGSAGAKLDQVAGGVAARLRYALATRSPGRLAENGEARTMVTAGSM